MTEHKTDMNITKYKKLNITQLKTDMSITNTKKNEHDKTQNREDQNTLNKME